MAKVTINATAHVRDGSMVDEGLRARLLETLGKNDKLLADIRDAFFAGTMKVFARPTQADASGDFVQVEYIKDVNSLLVRHLSATGEVKGAAIYGCTKFFSCLDEE